MIKKIILFIIFGLFINPVAANNENKNEILVPMDLSHWSFNSTKFSCYLSSSFFGGKFYFRSLPGGKNSFHLEYDNESIKADEAKIYIQSPPWAAEYSEQFVAIQHAIQPQRITFSNQIARLLQAAAQGQWLQLRLSGSATSAISAAKVEQMVLPTVRIQKPLAQFERCRTALPGMDYQQARTLTLSFATGQQQLNRAQQEKLQAFVSYVVLDEEIEHILVDGHTDSSGAKIANLSLSRQRAQQVADYLTQLGVAGGALQVRAHGERYPIADNAKASGREQNRRVVVRLVRRDEQVVSSASAPMRSEP